MIYKGGKMGGVAKVEVYECLSCGQQYDELEEATKCCESKKLNKKELRKKDDES